MAAPFAIRPAAIKDVDPAVAAIITAFASDPLMGYFFPDDKDNATRREFFSLLLRARIALDMPAYVLEQESKVLGLAMGYGSSRPIWPAPLAAAWDQLEGSTPGLAARFAAYDGISEQYQPKQDHAYLGVIGVHPSLQRQGAGAAMLESFCSASRADPKSSGVYLETSNPSSLRFYLSHGFELTGEGHLDTVPLWCLFRRI